MTATVTTWLGWGWRRRRLLNPKTTVSTMIRAIWCASDEETCRKTLSTSSRTGYTITATTPIRLKTKNWSCPERPAFRICKSAIGSSTLADVFCQICCAKTARIPIDSRSRDEGGRWTRSRSNRLWRRKDNASPMMYVRSNEVGIGNRCQLWFNLSTLSKSLTICFLIHSAAHLRRGRHGD